MGGHFGCHYSCQISDSSNAARMKQAEFEVEYLQEQTKPLKSRSSRQMYRMWLGRERYPKDIPNISPRYPQYIPKISPRYPQDIPKQEQQVDVQNVVGARKGEGGRGVVNSPRGSWAPLQTPTIPYKPLQSPTSPYKPTTVKHSLVGPTQGKPYTLHRGYCSNCFVDH